MVLYKTFNIYSEHNPHKKRLLNILWSIYAREVIKMVKDDSLYVIAIVAVVAVVGLVIMATGSGTVVVEELPSMAEEDSSAIAGEAFRTGSSTYDKGTLNPDLSAGISISAGSLDAESRCGPDETPCGGNSGRCCNEDQECRASRCYPK